MTPNRREESGVRRRGDAWGKRKESGRRLPRDRTSTTDIAGYSKANVR